MCKIQLPDDCWSDKKGKISIDFSSKTPSGVYILVMVCNRSRYPVMKISRGLTTHDAIRILSKVFQEFGTPAEIMSDNGPAFNSHAFADFANRKNFKHIKITLLWPDANGIVESKMKIIIKSIRCASVLKENWKTALHLALKHYRATIHPMTGHSPNQLMGFPDEIDLPSLPSLSGVDQNKLKNIDAKMRQNIRERSDIKFKAKM